MRNHPGRELVLTVSLPGDKGKHGDGRPRAHRFRSHWLELGRRLRDFRARYGLTQGEIARVVGASDSTTVTLWESGTNVPDGVRRERLTDLLKGRLWRELREAHVDGTGMPARWNEAARWYRRASRERQPREMIGRVVAAVLDDLRLVDSLEMLRLRYCERDGEWAHRVAIQHELGQEHHTEVRRIEDGAYGLRWLELVHGLTFELSRSVVPQLPLRLLDLGLRIAHDSVRKGAD
ncbi:MAG TPA: helix-turn-helix domain-containing protein [Chloroflexota bacterium]